MQRSDQNIPGGKDTLTNRKKNMKLNKSSNLLEAINMKEKRFQELAKQLNEIMAKNSGKPFDFSCVNEIEINGELEAFLLGFCTAQFAEDEKPNN